MSWNMPAGATQDQYEDFSGQVSDSYSLTGPNPFTVAALQCSREGCEALRVPSETEECRDHAIMSVIDMMADIAALSEMDEMDVYNYGVFRDELDRLRGEVA